MRKTMLVIIAGAAAFTLGPVPEASAANWIKVGVLRCDIEGGTNMVITSNKNLDCLFEPYGDYTTEGYDGKLNRVGLDIGKTDQGRLAWAVFAPSTDSLGGKLEGVYGGVSAEATVGYGLGANVLVGGFNNSIGLQPISLQTQQGIDVALGVASLDLTLQ